MLLSKFLSTSGGGEAVTLQSDPQPPEVLRNQPNHKYISIEYLNHVLRRHLLWYVLLSVILGLVYWFTLLPGIGVMGDVAKFQFLGKVLGTPHLSGYPTYIILNHFFVSLFPKGTLAFRSNLLSAIISIVSSWFLFETVVLLLGNRFIAFITSLTFGLIHSMWLFSLMAEVYSLNILFTASVIFFLLQWKKSRKDLHFYLACGIYAFSFGNHLITIGLIFAFAFMVWATKRSTFWDFKKILVVLLLILLAFSQYGYIAWRSIDPNPAFIEIDWFTFIHFLKSMGLSSRTFNFNEIFSERLPLLFLYFWQEFYIFLPVSIIGAFKIKDRIEKTFLAICLIGSSLFSLTLGVVREHSAFFLPVFLVMVIYLGVGLDYLSKRFLKQRKLSALLIIVPVFFFLTNYSNVDLSEKKIHSEIVEKVLNTIRHDGVVVVDEYDYACYFWYYLIGENYQKNGLYSFPISYAGIDGIRAYLQGEKPFYFMPQRKFVPLGLPVYVLWTLKDKISNSGMILESTGIKYIYRVRLPEE